MMLPTQRQLVIAGLIIVPFYELLFKVFPFVKVIAPDTREPKQLIAQFFCLAVFLLAVLCGGIKKFDNKWLLVLPLVILLSFFAAPSADLFINEVNHGDFYFWKPFSFAISYLLLVLAVASLDDDSKIIECIFWCGFVMSVYVVLQKLGFDQFWITKTEAIHQGFFEDKEIGGNLGQKTIVASFIAMLIPIAIYLKKYWQTVFMIAACLITKSDMAILALGFVLLGCYVIEKPNQIFHVIGIAFIGIVMLIISMAYNPKTLDFVQSRASGRWQAWENVVKDIRDGAIEGSKQDFSILGVGFGRYSVISPSKHNNQFRQVHNDYLELIYHSGIASFFVLILAIVFIVKRVIFLNTYQDKYLLCSLMTVGFCSMFSFCFQLASQQFYSAVILGLLSSTQQRRVQ